MSKATWRCSNKVTDTIDLYFSEPVLLAGNYTVQVQAGKDGNTLLTPCWQETPVDVAVPFSTKDTVSADFTYQLLLHCGKDTVVFYHDGAYGVNSWWWYFDDGADSSRLQTPAQYYNTEGVNGIKLVVSNGICSDTVSTAITRINVMNAGFRTASDTICPGADVTFINESSGNIAGQYWTFGNGNSSNLFTPPRQQYPIPVIRDQLYQVHLVVQSNMNCYDTVTQVMHVLNSCYIAVPTGFTPNGDGLNDYLYPLNGFYTTKLDFKVFNRFGQLLFAANSTSDKWDGRYKGEMQPPGVYVWMLSYIDKNTLQPVYLKGTSVLLR